ncbi:hypothetical protein Tco_0104551 [Tanacetum coccineum]
MLAIFNTAEPVVFKAPKPSSNAERVPQGTKPGAKPGHKKHSTSLKQPFVSSKEAIKGGSFKAPTSSKNGHSKKRKVSSSAMDSKTSQPLVSTPVDTGMHKEDQQVTGGPTFSGVTSEARANPQLSSVISIADADPRKSAPSDFVPRQQGLETVLTQPTTGKGASSIARQVEEDEPSRTIKLEDLAKLVSSVQPSFKDLDSPEDDPSLLLMTHKLELEKNKAKAEATLLKAQTSFPNMGQLNEILVKSLQTEFSKISSAHDFSSSLPTEINDLPSKFNELTEEVKGLMKQVHELEIELPGDLKEIPSKLEDFTKTVTSLTSQVAELKTLQWELPAEFLSMLSQVEMDITSKKTRDTNVPLVGQDGQPAEGEKNTNKATISYPPKSSSQPEGEHIKKDKGKKAMSSEEVEKESTSSGSNDDDETHATGSMVKSSITEKLKKFDFITEDGKHIHLTEEQINQQKKIEEEAKAEVAKHEGEVRKIELFDLLGPEVVNKYYNDKLQYDKYCDKMLNRRCRNP